MGKKATDRPEDKTTTKVATDVLRKLRIVADHRGVDLFDLLDSVLRPVAAKLYEDFLAEETGGKKR